MATLTDDGEMVYIITNDGFVENAVYHATCMTNYLLKRIKDDSADYLTLTHPDLSVVVLLSNHKNVFLIYVVVCVMCKFPFDQRADIQEKKRSSC
jgi:hypothetical protein